MGKEVSISDKELGEQLGQDIDILQIFTRDKEIDIHDESDREFHQPIEEGNEDEEGLSEWYICTEDIVSGNDE